MWEANRGLQIIFVTFWDLKLAMFAYIKKLLLLCKDRVGLTFLVRIMSCIWSWWCRFAKSSNLDLIFSTFIVSKHKTNLKLHIWFTVPILTENKHITPLHLSPFFYLIFIPGTYSRIHFDTRIPTGPTTSYFLFP